MNKGLGITLQVTLLSLLLTGCGSSDSALGAGTGGPSVPITDEQSVLNQAMLDDPAISVQLAPNAHLDQPPRSGRTPRVTASKGTAMNITVAELEAGYEIFFGSLSQQLGVTLNSPQVVSDINFIKSQPQTGFFDLNAKPILNNPLGVTGASFQPLDYTTTVPLPGGNQTFNVSGGLLMPLGIDKSRLQGVLVYFHGTTFNKAQVPSEYDGNPETQLLAQVFASQGYIVVMPDYVGQGDDWQNVHPYVLYPQCSAKTAVDMLNAVKPVITSQYGFVSGDPALKLFSAGYSEGGSYALWFNTYLQANGSGLDPFYNLVHSIGMEGAYSTSRVIFDYLFDNVSLSDNVFNIQNLVLVNIVKPLLSADAFLSYATWSQGSAFNSIFNPDFFSMTASRGVPQRDCNVNGQQVTIAQAFAQPATDISSPVLYSAFGKSANGTQYPGRLEMLTSTSNSVRSLASSALFSPQSLVELQQTMRAADADLATVPDNGVSIITLQQDSVVSPNNFDDLLAQYPTKIKNAIKVDQNQLRVVASVSKNVGRALWIPPDHLHGLIYEYLYALNIMNGF